MNSVTDEHKKDTSKPFDFAVISISTSRYDSYGSVHEPEAAKDRSGKVIIEQIKAEGHNLTAYSLIPDDRDGIKAAVLDAMGKGADIVVTTGGTGLAPSDVTIESLGPLFEKNMPGFGELFRYKSIEQIGSAVILTRADAGVISGKAIFCLPGSPGAVELAVKEIILPEAGHILRHLQAK